MKKKTLASTVLSIIIVSVVILAAGIRCALQPESKDYMQFSNSVTVTDTGIEHEIDPIHFEPIGEKVTFDVEIDGPDGGEIVGLIPEDQARVLSYLITLQAFRIREPSAFMSQIVRALIFAFRSTLPVDWNCEDLNKAISDLIYDEYDQILYHLKEEATAADPGTRHKEVDNNDK